MPSFSYEGFTPGGHIERGRMNAATRAELTTLLKQRGLFVTTEAEMRCMQQGFTLLELLLVISLVALVAQISFPIVKARLTPDLSWEVREMAAALRATRAHAMSTGQSQFVEVDIKAGTYRTPTKPQAIQLYAPSKIEVTRAKQFNRHLERSRIAFFSDGSSSGGRVELHDAKSRWRLQVRWLTGTIDVRELP